MLLKRMINFFSISFNQVHAFYLRFLSPSSIFLIIPHEASNLKNHKKNINFIFNGAVKLFVKAVN